MPGKPKKTSNLKPERIDENQLKPERIEELAARLPGWWKLAGDAIQTERSFDDGRSALNYMMSVAEMALRVGAAPQVELDGGTVRVRMPAGGRTLTEEDFALARVL